MNDHGLVDDSRARSSKSSGSTRRNNAEYSPVNHLKIEIDQSLVMPYNGPRISTSDSPIKYAFSKSPKNKVGYF